MINPFHFDYADFSKCLADAVPKAFYELKATYHASETIYASGVAMFENWSSRLVPFMLTEERLTERAEDRFTNPHTRQTEHLSLADHRILWRYCVPVDYVHDIEYNQQLEALNEVNRLVSGGAQSYTGMLISAQTVLTDNEFKALKREHEEKYREACLSALHQADNSGLFSDIERHHMTLMLTEMYYANGTEENQPNIERLNPSPVVKKFRLHVKACRQIMNRGIS